MTLLLYTLPVTLVNCCAGRNIVLCGETDVVAGIFIACFPPVTPASMKSDHQHSNNT